MYFISVSFDLRAAIFILAKFFSCSCHSRGTKQNNGKYMCPVEVAPFVTVLFILFYLISLFILDLLLFTKAFRL